MGMIKFCSIALLMTTVMTTGTARYIPASNYILLEKLINQYDPSGVNYDYGEDDQDNQVALKKDALLLEKLMLTLQKNAEDDSNAIELQDRKRASTQRPTATKVYD